MSFPTPIDALLSTKEVLPSTLREAILALGASAIPSLIAIAEDEELGSEDAPGEGWPPVHAVDLLVDLEAVEAIEPLLNVLVATDFDMVVHDRILMRLSALGEAVLEPALARLASLDDDDDAHSSLCAVLASLGVRDERIFEALCEAFDVDETAGSLYFGDYGDPRALPWLVDAIASFEPNFGTPLGILGLADLVEAYERIGGALPPDLRVHVDSINERWAAHTQSVATRAGAKKIGRNDPCPCGSGKKYKKCCIDVKATAGEARS